MKQHTTILYWILGIVVIVGLFFVASKSNQAVPNGTTNDEQQIRSVVEKLGARLKQVSILSPTAPQDIRAQYAGIFSEEIIAGWEQNPMNALGRRTSSPWPERIEIQNIEKLEDGSYEVQGAVIETTNADIVSQGVASQYSVTFKFRNRNGSWVITGYQSIAPAQQ